MSVRDWIRHFTGLALLAGLSAGVYWSSRLAWADLLFRRDTEAAVKKAVGLVPWNAEYHARLAAILEGSGEDGAEEELRKAVGADPRLASGWVELGLRAESAGDTAGAEALLLHAARADRTYSTEWTLANFYFRHEQREKFWNAARRALAIGDVRAYDPAPLFGLCWKLSPDPDTVLARAIPDVGPVVSRYLQFLVRENLAPAAEPVTERVVALGGDDDLGAVFEYCDRLIAKGDAERAIHAWNALCWRTLHGYRPLAPAAGVSLTNADFSAQPVEHGFDWRMPPNDGIVVERGGMPPRLWITLDGHEPETCDLAEQVAPVVPERKYRLRFRYQTDGLTAPSGVRWRLTNAAGPDEIQSDAVDLASEQETGGVIRFSVPAGVRLVRLALAYRRVPGTVRIEGRVSVSEIALEFDR
jgi:tetratricopeptide (TPR) repeat protein